MPKALDVGDPPEELLYIMRLMRQFDTGGRLDWQQIAAWQQVTGIKLTPVELEVMRQITEAREKPL